MIDWLISCIRGKIEGSVPRRTGKDYDLKGFNDLCWLAGHKGLKHPDIPFSYENYTKETYLKAVEGAVERIDDKNDCADFTALKLVDLAIESKDFLLQNPDVLKRIEKCLTGFSFWITDSKKDSMCYYSENHQICFATVEYLSGVLFPEAVFACDGLRGSDHAKRALERMKIWFSLRREFGFSEFLSNNYLPIDVGALSVLLLHGDQTVADMAKEALDRLIWYYATCSFKGTFINASGRDYPGNLAGTKERSLNSDIVLSVAFGDPEKYLYERERSGAFFVKAVLKGAYRVPEETKKRVHENIDEVLHFGLDTADYGEHGLLKGDTRSLMMQLGSGALTNPSIIDQTYKTINRNNLWHHDFVHWLRFMDFPVLRHLGLMPLCSKVINYFQNGMSLESAKVHVVRTGHYKLSVLEDYFPGSFGAQKNTLAITLDNGTSFYINHPLRPCPMEGADKFPFDTAAAPSYFGGYNRAPLAKITDENTVAVIYRLPLLRGAFAPCRALHYTHAYFDRERYDEVILKGNRLFARAGDSFMAVLAKENLTLNSPDLIQKGRNTYWLIILSDTEKETFDAFVKRVSDIRVSFDGFTLKAGDQSIWYRKKLP